MARQLRHIFICIAALLIVLGASAVIQADEVNAAAFKPVVKVNANKVTVTWKKQKGFKKYEVYSKLFYSSKKIKKVLPSI